MGRGEWENDQAASDLWELKENEEGDVAYSAELIGWCQDDPAEEQVQGVGP
jgi:hypothetical protein